MENLFGRTQIFCDEPVTESNAVKILSDALSVHERNRSQINYLYDYQRGDQPILLREQKEYMPSCNKIVVNRANELVSFKDGYLLGEPVQYISRGENQANINSVNQLNAFMDAASKTTEDMDLVHWMHICGTGYRLTLPNKGDTETPFSIYTLDPRNTFVVYLNDVSQEPQMAVNYVNKNNNETVYTCYLKNKSFEIKQTTTIMLTDVNTRVENVISYASPHIPLVEFPANRERLGVFEKVIKLLDAINNAESNRLDGVEQFVQAILCLVGTDLEEEQAQKLLHLRMLALPPSRDGKNVDVKYLVQELDQTQTQVLIDNMYEEVLDICGVPSRSGGASTSDTGQAVVLREGWSSAEGRAKVTESMFKRSDRKVLQNILKILNTNGLLELSASDVEAKFSRHNYEGLTVKSNALVSMLNNPKIHPLDAYQQSNLFIDSEAAYKRGMEYYDENMEYYDENMESEAANAGTKTDEPAPASTSGDSAPPE